MGTPELPEEVRLWVTRLENVVNRSDASDEKEDDFPIYSASAELITKDEDIRGSLHPTVVTVGPVHYNTSMDVFLEGNKLKEEALRKVIAADESVGWNPIFSDLVQKMVNNEEDIKACYVNRNAFPFYLTGNTFGWMIVSDCCFLLQVFSLMSNGNGRIGLDRSKWPRLATFVGGIDPAGLQEPLLDLIKIDNQIPLWVIADVANSLPGWAPTQTEMSAPVDMLAVMSILSPIRILMAPTLKWREAYEKRQSNLLYLLRLYVVGSEANPDEAVAKLSASPAEETKNSSAKECVECLDEFTSSSFIYSDGECFQCNRCCTCLINSAVWVLSFVVVIALLAVVVPLCLAMLLLMLPFLLMACIWARSYHEKNTELKLRAVCLSASVGMGCSLDTITKTRLTDRFLWMPRIRAGGEHTKVTMSNIVALERLNPRLRKIVCKYVSFISQLLDTPEDVEELQNRVIIPVDKDRKWMSEMWKSLRRLAKGTTETDATDPISIIRAALLLLPQPARVELISPALRFWTRDLRRRYGANPWVALSATAAIVLLFMTGAQVVCLFVSCSLKTNDK